MRRAPGPLHGNGTASSGITRRHCASAAPGYSDLGGLCPFGERGFSASFPHRRDADALRAKLCLRLLLFSREASLRGQLRACDPRTAIAPECARVLRVGWSTLAGNAGVQNLRPAGSRSAWAPRPGRPPGG